MLAREEGSSSLNSSSPAINKNVLGADSKNALAGDVYFQRQWIETNKKLCMKNH